MFCLSFILVASAQTPCTDSLYNSLKATPVNQMSQREYEYFTTKSTECSEYQTKKETKVKTRDENTRIVLLVSVITIVTVIMPIFIFTP